MPKITGPNIAQHVADQESAVFSAATRLFAEHGVDNVAMAMIADEVGLARSSLYRYFPTKSAIVHRWFEVTIAPLIDDSERIARSDASHDERFSLWVERQIDFLSDPDNQAMIRASLETDELSDRQRSSIIARHHDLYASLYDILTEAGTGTADGAATMAQSGSGDRADVPPARWTGSDVDVTARTRALLIVGSLRSVSDLSADGIADSIIRAELLRAARLIAGIDTP